MSNNSLSNLFFLIILILSVKFTGFSRVFFFTWGETGRIQEPVQRSSWKISNSLWEIKAKQKHLKTDSQFSYIDFNVSSY